MSRQKKYKMKAISSAISEKGGFTAQFIGDGYSVDARKEILPNTIKENGVQVGEGVAWNLIQSFLKNCAAQGNALSGAIALQRAKDGGRGQFLANNPIDAETGLWYYTRHSKEWIPSRL